MEYDLTFAFVDEYGRDVPLRERQDFDGPLDEEQGPLTVYFWEPCRRTSISDT